SSKFGLAIEFYLLAIFYTSNVNRPYLIKNKKGFLLQYYYRVKTLESIDDKINRYSLNTDQYPVNNWLNDIFGARIILNTQEVEELSELLDGWQEKFGLKNWYFRDKSGYRGLHTDFKNNSNFYFAWELQIWDEKDELTNIENHEKYKRMFV
ncbi:nucleotidyltransferase family protein, partial [Acinetobacter ursingii]